MTMTRKILKVRGGGGRSSITTTTSRCRCCCNFLDLPLIITVTLLFGSCLATARGSSSSIHRNDNIENNVLKESGSTSSIANTKGSSYDDDSSSSANRSDKDNNSLEPRAKNDLGPSTTIKDKERETTTFDDRTKVGSSLVTSDSDRTNIIYDPYAEQLAVYYHNHRAVTANNHPKDVSTSANLISHQDTRQHTSTIYNPYATVHHQHYSSSSRNENNVSFKETDVLGSSGSSCESHLSCQECYDSSSTCHWCSDGTCHAKGSVYGCFRGESCPSDDGPTPTPPAPAPKPKPTPPTPDNKKKKQNCADHATCSECALSSMFCHWCGFDNQCHSIGSIHGCTTGVNCYANDRCHRTTPEPLNNPFWISLSPMLLIYCIASTCIMICCYTCCFCGLKATKGAYEDMVLNTAAATADVVLEQQSIAMSRAGMSVGPRTVVVHKPLLQSIDETSNDDDDVNDDGENNDDEEGHTNNRLTEKRNEGQSSGSITREHPYSSSIPSSQEQCWENLEDPQVYYPTSSLMTPTDLPDDTSELSQTLLPKSMTYSRSRRGDAATRAETILSRKSYRDSLKSRHTQCLFGCCSLLYVCLILLTIGMGIMTLLFFPRMPKYNVCNNEFDWKSIVEGMASAKLEAEFELLLSIQNPNRFGVELVMGSGTFTHDGTYVGRFDIPSHTMIGKQSISDVLVTITLKPDKWEALALTTEYYRGTLVFSVDTAITVSAPALMGYTYGAKFGNVLIHVSDNMNDDRSLCACPQWKDEKKKKPNTSATSTTTWDQSMNELDQTDSTAAVMKK